jgi:hypothetical protein
LISKTELKIITMATVNIPVTIPLDMVEEFKAYLESKYMVQADSQWRVTPKEQGNKVVAHKYIKEEQRYVLLVQLQGQQFPCWYSEEEAQKSVGDAQILEYFKTANGTWMGREPIDLYLLHCKAKKQAREQEWRSQEYDYDGIAQYHQAKPDIRSCRLNSYINRKERTFDFTHNLIGDEI